MKEVKTRNAPAAIGPYSQAIIANGFLFCSGQIPLKKDGSLIGPAIEEQTEQVLKNIIEILKSQDRSLESIVKTTIFLKDIEDFNLVNEIYAKYFGDHKPARSTVEVSRLPKDALIEIEFIASLN